MAGADRTDLEAFWERWDTDPAKGIPTEQEATIRPYAEWSWLAALAWLRSQKRYHTGQQVLDEHVLHPVGEDDEAAFEAEWKKYHIQGDGPSTYRACANHYYLAACRRLRQEIERLDELVEARSRLYERAFMEAERLRGEVERLRNSCEVAASMLEGASKMYHDLHRKEYGDSWENCSHRGCGDCRLSVKMTKEAAALRKEEPKP